MKKKKKERRPAARVCGPRRGVPLMMTTNVEDAVPATHPIRGVWEVVSALDWSGYLSRLRARGSRAGRPALDPRSLATLWVWAMSEGIVSARALARRCDTDFACRWALGGETVSHHTLSDFLRQDCGTLDALLSQTVGALHRSGAASFDTLLVDGTKVKARAGADSFENAEALEEMASRWLSRIRGGLGETAKSRAARARAEREYAERRAEAVKMVRKRQADLRAKQGPAAAARCSGKVKASLSDAEARMMRHADGGKRPSVNVQVGTCAQSGAVLYVAATDRGADRGLCAAAVRGMENVCKVRPRRVVADGGYAGLRDAAAVRALGVDYLVPPRQLAQFPSRRACLGGAVRAAERWWHELWAGCGAAARRVRLRVERVIGSLKRRGMRRIPVFGLLGAARWARWQALTHNLMLLQGVRG